MNTKADAGGDDEGTARADERIAQGGNGASVLLADADEVREVVVEGAVDDAVCLGGSAAEAVEVFKTAAMGFGTGGLEGFGASVGAGEPEHRMAGVDEFRDDGRAMKPVAPVRKLACAISFYCRWDQAVSRLVPR